MSKIDANQILKNIKKKERTRGSISIYLDRPLFEEFRSACGDVSPSKVLEEFMHQFVDSKKKK